MSLRGVGGRSGRRRSRISNRIGQSLCDLPDSERRRPPFPAGSAGCASWHVRSPRWSPLIAQTRLALPRPHAEASHGSAGRARSHVRLVSFSTESSNSAYESMSASTPKAIKIARRRNMSRWATSRHSACSRDWRYFDHLVGAGEKRGRDGQTLPAHRDQFRRAARRELM